MIRGSWVLTAILNFLVAAIFGLLLRAAFVWEIEWMDYKYFLHAHSHAAMLGWVYLILYALFLGYFVSPEKSRKPIYKWLFWLTQLSVIGMMISFPLQGYALYSIAFSSLHVILSYVFVVKLWRDLKSTDANSVLLLKTALIALLISTVGLWGMGPIMALELRSSPLYFIAVQFYLHFQFNGWFVLGVLALLFSLFHSIGVNFRKPSVKLFLALYVVGMSLTFFHVLAWAYGKEYMFIINSGGVLFQFAAVFYLFYLLSPHLKHFLQKLSAISRVMLYFALIGIVFKALFQALLVIPPLAEVSTIIRNFMIGYIHLITLGITTMLIFLLLKQYFGAQLKMKAGVILFLIGYTATEVMLLLQGAFYWLAWGKVNYYHEILLLFTCFLPIALGIITFRNAHLTKIREL